jgi:aminoglycoside phosphotransferase (APT) family kinase protein
MPAPKKHPDDIDIDESLVRRLIANQFPRWADLPVARVRSAGTDNAIFRLGDDIAVRLPRLSRAAETVDTELRWLPRLSRLLPLAVPVPLGKGAPDDGFAYPWSVYRWLDGDNLVDRPDVDLDDAARRLGRFVAALRRIDAAGGPPSFRGGPVSALDDRVRAEIRELGADGAVDAEVTTTAWEAALGAPTWQTAPVWVHGDLYPLNLLARQGRLAAVIDFGGLGVGDPACDLLPAWAVLTASTRELFRAEAGVDDATWVRGRGWGLALGLGAAHVYRVTNPILAASAGVRSPRPSPTTSEPRDAATQRTAHVPS